MESNNLENEERESKQKLLNQEITNKNYNQVDFINFCLSKRENGDNIDNWTYNELLALVKEFKKNNINQDEEFNINNNLDNDNDNIAEDKEIEDDDTINIENEIEKKNEKEREERQKYRSDKKHKSKNKKEKVEKIIKCKTLEKTELNDKDIIIEIKDPIEINAGLFSKNYIAYTVETQPLGWKVQRRYNDFDLLRKLLIKHFPFYKVAPLPIKKSSQKKFEKDYISKRMVYLNNFINNIIKNETFKASEILNCFLSIEDRNQFDNKFKELNNEIYGGEGVEDYKSLNGEVILLFDETNDKYFDNINNYLKLQNEIFVKLNQDLKSFYKNMSSAVENINGIINNLGILYNINSNVSMKEVITNSYEGLQNLFKGWKKIIFKQNSIIKNRIKHFFKYINLTNNSYKEIIEKRIDLKNKFSSENTKLKYKKEKLYAYKDINKYEIDKDIPVDNQRLIKDKKYAFRMMCTNETNNLSKIYKIIGYGNKIAMIELKELIKENSNDYLENFKKLKEEFNPTINEFSELWNKYELFLNNINNKKKPKYKNSKSKNEEKNKDKKNINNIINNDENANNDI